MYPRTVRFAFAGGVGAHGGALVASGFGAAVAAASGHRRRQNKHTQEQDDERRVMAFRGIFLILQSPPIPPSLFPLPQFFLSCLALL
jgi:hypothetical protein